MARLCNVWLDFHFSPFLPFCFADVMYGSVNGDGDLDLPSSNGNYRCGGEWHTDPASDRKIEPCNLSTTAPLVINRVTDQVDLARKANPCLCNEEHKQEQERTQPNCRWMINLSKLGSHKPMKRRNCYWQNNLCKTQTLMEERWLFMKTLGSCKDPWMHP